MSSPASWSGSSGVVPRLAFVFVLGVAICCAVFAVIAHSGSAPGAAPRPPRPSLAELKPSDGVQASLPGRGTLLADVPPQCRSLAVVRGEVAQVPVLEIRAGESASSRQVIVYFHGGAYAFGSPIDALPAVCTLALETKAWVISVDYTTAPAARWRDVTRQGADVVAALIREGREPRDIAIAGDSAGGGLAIAVALRLRDEGRGLISSVVVWSPWADLSGAGDTRTTLAAADPIIDDARLLRPAARLYADPADWKNPLVSPVYADFSKGFPPTLIQAGTREILLSDAVRLFQAIDVATGHAVLDIYDGSAHAFQTTAGSDTARRALSKSAAFIVTAFRNSANTKRLAHP